MDFSYIGYCGLVQLLKMHDYQIADYHNYQQFCKCVILRHDIDFDIPKALRLAEIEAEQQVKSTYFVLLNTDFYNPASRNCVEKLRKIQQLGHEIGLHFDEKAYPMENKGDIIRHIIQERDILSSILQTPVTCVSMHRPSKATLEADLEIEGMVNSYGKNFFHGFKYLSDSRRNWREPVEDIICSRAYDRLHILTHAFWYNDQEQSMIETVHNFIQSANTERYEQMKNNITDIASIFNKE